MFAGDTIELKRTLAHAVGEARSLSSSRTGTEHLLLGLLAVRHPVADLLMVHGVDVARLRQVVRETGPDAGGRDARAPFSLEAKAAYEASLRLALARRERAHGPEHLTLTLISLDPDVDRALSAIGADHLVVWDALADAYPPPRRNSLLRLERGYWRRSRSRDLVHRYKRATGRMAVRPTMLTALIATPA